MRERFTVGDRSGGIMAAAMTSARRSPKTSQSSSCASARLPSAIILCSRSCIASRASAPMRDDISSAARGARSAATRTILHWRSGARTEGCGVAFFEDRSTVSMQCAM